MLPVIGHEPIQRELRALASSDVPPHALLLDGPEGTGRTQLALFYAKLLNCESRPGAARTPSLFASLDEVPSEPLAPGDLPCGRCRPCTLIEAGGHPDIIRVGPGDTLCHPRAGESSHASHADSRDIRICQVRGMIDLASRFPLEASQRVIIVEPAERLGHDAAHTILKTLEEPPGHTVFVLVTAAPDQILETILSRCRRIEVRPVARQEIEDGLIARGVEPALAARAAAEARGRPARAIAYSERPDLMDDRGRLLDRCAKIAAARTIERFNYAEDLSRRWRSDRNQVLAEIDVWEAFWEERLRSAAETGDEPAAEGALAALHAVGTVRDDLQANVIARAALELMLLNFPRTTLDLPREEEAPAHA
jgi:DNA polymerase-3 subunit delta'